ncbi:MAG: O-acetylhomoserine aminocarboxypropyltransferase/cysteine synthase [Planctomycetes bacterium]|nr:O-acetylhomoserine aminocarboxypropyltransferase/cysteine synthase [Planctomycetota bacterium]
MNNTTAIHAGDQKKSDWGQSTVPVYQTVSYGYQTAKELEAVFSGRALGHIYSRISNPTTAVLERRLADMEGAVGCIATASGMAAISAVVLGLLKSGDHIVASSGLFGGTISLFNDTCARMGITTHYVDVADTGHFARALTPETKLLFVETIGNPKMDVPDIPAVAELAQQAGIPLVVDSTMTPPLTPRMKALGADIVIHSTTKFINGHGTAMGGAILDTGRFDWANSSFDTVKPYRQAGQLALLAYLRNGSYRDLGGCAAPMNSFLMLQGLETLPLRMTQHHANARRLATFLQDAPEVDWVNYPGLADSPFADRIDGLFDGQAGAVLTFGLGSKERSFRFLDSVKLARNMTNLGDAKTLVLHPASTIFYEFDREQQTQMGVAEDTIRVSVGLEDTDDIVDDFAQAIALAVREAV